MIGGARKGAGRKPRPDTKKRPISVKLPPWLIAWMRAHQPTSQAVLIEEALIAKHGLKPPEVQKNACKS